MNRIAAGIVTFNPDIDRFSKSLNSISSQCELVVVYDNHSSNISAIKEIVESQSHRVELIMGDKNNGIAYAINRMIEYASLNDFKWFITLDHDSICPPSMVREYEKYVDLENIGALCPKVVDENIIVRKYSSDIIEGYTEVSECIQSGTAYNINICKELGMFYEWYFIDYVDFDYSTCLTVNGYKILRVNTVQLDHELGAQTKTWYSGLGQFLYSITGFKKFLYLTYLNTFSEFRMYYQFRNGIVYIKRYNKYLNSKEKYKELICTAFKRILRSNCKIKTTKGIIRGIVAGMKEKPDEYRKPEY